MKKKSHSELLWKQKYSLFYRLEKHSRVFCCYKWKKGFLGALNFLLWLLVWLELTISTKAIFLSLPAWNNSQNSEIAARPLKRKKSFLVHSQNSGVAGKPLKLKKVFHNHLQNSESAATQPKLKKALNMHPQNSDVAAKPTWLEIFFYMISLTWLFSLDNNRNPYDEKDGIPLWAK